MPSYTWSSAVSGNWSTATNWSPNGVPGELGGDTVTIGATGADYTITYDESAETLNFLTINSANALLAFDANDILNINNSTTLQAGTIDLENDGDVLNTGTLAAGSLSTSAGSTINIGADALVNYYGATLGGLVDITGTTTFGSNSAAITLSGTIEATGGTGTVQFASLTGAGALEAAGATLLVTSSLANSSAQLVISDSASSVFETTGALYYGGSVQISFLGTQGGFEYDNSANDTHVTFNISGLNAGTSTTIPTNFIGLDDEVLTITSGGTGTTTTGSVTLSNGDTLALSGITGLGSEGWAAHAVFDGNGGTDVFLAAEAACYARGTMILSDRGEVPIEELSIGDLVVTLHDEAKPIRWIGRRAYDARFVASNRALQPILIRQDALDDGVPRRDLYVSSKHALFLDDVLVPAERLVNGVSIVRCGAVATLEYFHIELDTHDIILAEGAPSETFIDCDNRGMFQNAHEFARLYPDHDAPTWAFCAPRIEEGDVLQYLRWRLDERLEAFGCTTTFDPDLHLVVDGIPVSAGRVDGTVHVFRLDRPAREVRIVSRTSVPAELDVASTDIRRLGVNVSRVTLRSNDVDIVVECRDTSLVDGFHASEGTHRWTDGDARIPVKFLACFDKDVTIEVHVQNHELSYRTGQWGAERFAATAARGRRN